MKNKELTKKVELRLNSTGYIAPKNKELEILQKEVYNILGYKISDLTRILAAFWGTMNDKNGESIGLFVALPNNFIYVAGVPEKQHMICEEFPYDKISEFISKADGKRINSLTFKIYNEQVEIVGFNAIIPDNFMVKLKKKRILLFELNQNPN